MKPSTICSTPMASHLQTKTAWTRSTFAREHHPDLILMDIQLRVSGLKSPNGKEERCRCVRFSVVAVTDIYAIKGDAYIIRQGAVKAYISEADLGHHFHRNRARFLVKDFRNPA